MWVLSFHSPDPLWLRHFELTNKTPNRLVRIPEAVLLYQILVDMLRAQARFNLGRYELSQRLALTLAPAPTPTIEMAGLGSRPPSSLPGIEMAGFDNPM